MNTVTIHMTADRFWDLLSKKIAGEASEEELSEWTKLLESQPGFKTTAETLELLWQQPIPDITDEATQAFDLHVEKMKQLGVEFHEQDENNSSAIPADSPRRSKKTRWMLLALAILVSTVGLILFRNMEGSGGVTKRSTEPLSQVITKPGSQTQLQLPDGSKVWLNASSNLTYDKSFGKSLREVNLTGEAFFDVVKDPAHPFIIHTKVIDVKVLGTQFDVKAYPNDAYTEASLIRGSVEVTVKGRPDEKHYLKPNEKVSVANNISEPAEKMIRTKPFIVTQPLTYYHADSTIIETSWVDNKLVFQENETFRDVALKMERWFGGITITFADEGVADYRIYGSFTDETITQALDALKEAFNFSYKITGNNIIITK